MGRSHSRTGAGGVSAGVGSPVFNVVVGEVDGEGMKQLIVAARTRKGSSKGTVR